MTEQLLIVEDDRELNRGLCSALKAPGRNVVSCLNLREAREQLLCGGISAVILDVNLPDGSGISLLREIKEKDDGLPVLLLTANDMDSDIVDGLEQGADDYITKPFSLTVLRARVNAQLRRAAAVKKREASGDCSGVEEFDGFRFDFDRMQFFAGETPVELSKTEQKLLRMLVENRGRAVSRERLIDWIWTDGAEYVEENALSVTVKRLRDKLGATEYIRTVYGIGYMWKKGE